MKNIIALAALALVTGCTAASAGQSAEMQANSEAKLAAALRGYDQSGPPVSCVNQRDLGGNRSAGDAIIFSGNRGTLYVNRPAGGGCSDLQFGRALITRTSGSQLCRGDIASVFDPVSHTEFGGCGLGDFTPYKRSGRRHGA
jgi:hypothetical protein